MHERIDGPRRGVKIPAGAARRPPLWKSHARFGLRNVPDLGAGPVSFSLNAPGDAKPGQMRVVVFAQQSGQGAVLGAASAGVTP